MASRPERRRRSSEPPAVLSLEPAPAATARVAAIDIGSNSLHMLVVEGTGGGDYRVLARDREMVRLGKSALGRGKLSKKAIRDGLETLLRMTTLARLKGAERIVAVATSAVREASNGAEFLEMVQTLAGIDVRLLSGEEEGRLVFRAVQKSLDLGDRSAVVADIGGGSTEWCVVEDGELRSVASLALGSIRCAKSLDRSPPSARAVERLRKSIRKRLRDAPRPGRVGAFVATSGTAVCCGLLADHFAERGGLALAGGSRELGTSELRSVVEHLRTLKRREIASLPAVGDPRSTSILAGAILLQELAAHADVDRLLISDRALREGLVLETLGAPATGDPASGSVRRRQVLELARRAPSMLPHAEQVARLAVRLFDLTAPMHRLGSRERTWLEAAALLHDVGYSIHFQRHHKHAHYLISTADLDAFDRREIEVIAQVARYHRGARPKLRHPAFAALRPWQRETVRRLSALLRVANALDRTHAARVLELHASLVKRRRVVIEVLSPYDVELELSAARFRSDLFEEVFGRRLVVRQGLEPSG